jgi:hypothetical protein
LPVTSAYLVECHRNSLYYIILYIIYIYIYIYIISTQIFDCLDVNNDDVMTRPELTTILDAVSAVRAHARTHEHTSTRVLQCHDNVYALPFCFCVLFRRLHLL